MTRKAALTRDWSQSSNGGIRASEADFGPYLLAAYGHARRYCWEVLLGGRYGKTIAEGEASTLPAAQAAAEAAATDLLTATRTGAARGLPPAPETRH